jgi:glycerate-2-kinase
VRRLLLGGATIDELNTVRKHLSEINSTTLDRAAAQRLDATHFLSNNDSYHFFSALDDLVRTGPTGTNVGDLQVALIA